MSEITKPRESEESKPAELNLTGVNSSAAVDQTIILGEAGQSVLFALGKNLESVPRVLLRESPGESPEPLLGPAAKGAPPGAPEGRYQLHGEIARGGMGAILRGRDTDLGRDLAIKVLLDSHRDRPEIVQRFVEEAQIGGQLQHPGIVPVYELGQFADQRPYFSMKLVKGQTLAYLLSERANPLEERPRFLGIFQQVCQTLAYAHSRGVIHRDLKPANIMVGAFGEVQVMDWGLAKVLATGGVADEKKAAARVSPESAIRMLHRTDAGGVPLVGSQTIAGSVMGTPAYMAPEQALGEIDRLDERADVFGLGAILCEILTGLPPYTGQDGTEVFRRAARGNLEECYALLAACKADQELIGLARDCLAAEPQGRPRNAGIVADQIARYLSSVDARLRAAEVQRASEAARAEEAQRTAAEHEAAARAERRARRLQVGLAVGVLCVALLGGMAALWAAIYQNGLKREILLENKKAVAAREAEARQREVAEAEKRRADLTLADMQASRGLLAAERDAPAEAALWFAAAAEQAQAAKAAGRTEDNRLRTRNWLRRATLPVGVLALQRNARSIAFQPGGDLLLVQGEGQDIHLWSWKEGQFVAWSDALREYSAACFSPDGAHLALGSPEGMVHIRAVQDGAVIQEIPFSERVTALAYQSDGGLLAIGGQIVRAWDTAARAFRQPTWAHPDSVLALSFNRRGDRLLSFAADRKARVFAVNDEAQNAAPLFAPIPHLPNSNSLPALINDDRSLVSITANSELTRWSMATGTPEPPHPIRVKPWGLSRLVSSPDGKWFVVGGYYGPELHKALEPNSPPVHLAHTNLVTDYSFSPDGTELFSVSWDQTARFWKAPGGEAIGAPLPHMGNIVLCAWSSDGRHVATAQADGLIRVWLRPREEIAKSRLNAWGLRPRICQDGQSAAPGMWHEAPTNYEHQQQRRLSIVSSFDGKPAGKEIQLAGELVDSCLASDGLSVAAVYLEGQGSYLGVWNVRLAEPLFPAVALPARPRSVAARPGGNQFAVLCASGELFVVDGVTGQVSLRLNHEGWPRSNTLRPQLRYAPDGKTLVSLSEGANNAVYVRDADSGELRFPPIRPATEPTSTARSFAFSADSRLLATIVNGNNTAQVWNLATGAALSQPLPHPGDIYGLFAACFSPDGKYLLTGCKDGQARYWDWQQGTLACPAMAHADEVFDVAIVPGGKYAMTVVRGRPPSVSLWELTTGKRIAPPVVLGDSTAGFAQTVAITPDGKRALVSVGGGDLTVLDLEVLLAASPTSTEEMELMAELATAQQIELGGLGMLSSEQWRAKWNTLRERNPGLVAASAILARPTERPPTAAPRPALASNQRLAYARRGRWSEAAAAALAEIAGSPSDRILWSRAAALYLLAGDVRGYEQLCSRMLEQFGVELSAEQSDSLCKVCLLRPDTVDPAKLPTAPLREAVARDTTSDGLKSWYTACLALCAYREEEYDEAVRWCERSLEYNQGRNHSGALALVVLAMAEQRRARTDEAVEALVEVSGLIPRELATLGTNHHRGTLPVAEPVVSHDWLIPEILRREAVQLILGENSELPANNESPALELARERAARRDWADAAKRYRELLKLPADNGHAWLEYVAVLVLSGDRQTAKSVCADLIKDAGRPGVRPYHVARACTLAQEFAAEAEAAGERARAELSLDGEKFWSLTQRAALHCRAGRFAEALPLLEESSRADPQPGRVVVNSLWRALALARLGETKEAQDEYLLALEFLREFRAGWFERADGALGLHLHNWLEALILRAEGEALIEPQFAEFLQGKTKPTETAQRLVFMNLCLFHERYHAAAKLFQEALSEDPGYFDGRKTLDRYNAACYAVLASEGRGDGKELPDDERRGLREQAAKWLREELSAVRRQMENATFSERATLFSTVLYWRRDPDLAGIREADSLEKLSEEERADLKRLWAEVENFFKPTS